MTDGRVVDIEVYRAATKTFEKVTSITMDSTLADGWTSSDYLCNYKWTTYSIDITLHPGDNVAVISTNKSRFAIDDIMIVKKIRLINPFREADPCRIGLFYFQGEERIRGGHL